VFIFIVVALAHLADQMFNIQTPLLQDATIFWYGANEFISILKNGSALGVPIPAFMEKAALAAKEKSEGENINGK
jgi:toxin secretion/phage lysis holin